MLGSSLTWNFFDSVNWWGVQTLLEEWIASRAGEGGSSPSSEVSCKKSPKVTQHEPLVRYWKIQNRPIAWFDFIIWMPSMRLDISQFIVIQLLPISYLIWCLEVSLYGLCRRKKTSSKDCRQFRTTLHHLNQRYMEMCPMCAPQLSRFFLEIDLSRI